MLLESISHQQSRKDSTKDVAEFNTDGANHGQKSKVWNQTPENKSNWRMKQN